MTIENIRRALYEQKNRIGLVGGTIRVEEYDEAEHPISAHIDAKSWDITIELRKGYVPIRDSKQRVYARLKNIGFERSGAQRRISKDGLETVLSDVTLHECTHWEAPVDSELGCPYDIYNHDKILEAVKESLPDDKEGYAGYVTNVFEDILVNTRGREFRGDFSGQVLFWDNEGLLCKEKGMNNFTPLYEAFVKLNMHLWGDRLDRALLKRHYSNEEKVDRVVKKVIDELSLHENISDSSVLFNREQWPEMARIFTRNIADLLDEDTIERLSAYSPQESSQGSGEDPKDAQAGNGFDEKMKTPEGKEEIAYGRFASKESQSRNFTSFEQLDSLYKRLARDIPVKVETMSREQSLEIAPLNYRPFDPERDDPAKMRLSKTFITSEGIQFAHKREPLTIIAKSKIQRRSFPDFKMLVLDNSGSMTLAPDDSDDVGSKNFIPWGENSKYHYALLGLYGVENFLQKQGISQYINHGLSLFSSRTRYKESDFSGLSEVRKQALSPDWGATNLDAGVLEDALRGKESFVLSLSDGGIGNWDSAKSRIERLVKDNHFAHIQLGSATAFTNDLESWGVPVYFVSNGKDLSKLMVDVTQKTYRKFYQLTHEVAR